MPSGTHTQKCVAGPQERMWTLDDPLGEHVLSSTRMRSSVWAIPQGPVVFGRTASSASRTVDADASSNI